jgi:ubiquinone/menaquinone biosynthesis C-methylase UbiE
VDAPPLTPLAAAVLHVPAPERALLIGAGDGEAAFFLAREFPAARVRATDASAEMVRNAQAKVGLDPEGRVAFKRARPAALPYPDDFFDLVVQMGGRIVPAELRRVLRTGRHLILVSSRHRGLASGARESLMLWRLARHGFFADRMERAGDGNFTVARVGDPG